ncbi:MAG: 30S ribosomal protein S6 [Candidatus Moranbacteria bacterium]|nr:30S ribosomal protein S6 [Candidatus Moranbacteria bacterium]
MANDVSTYEIFYLVGESRDSELPKVREEMEKIVTGFGGTFLPEETEEKRNLAYEIRKERRGTYVARRFTIPMAGDEPFVEKKEEKENPLDGINRLLRLYEPVLRFIVLRADKLPELKSIARVERPRQDRRGGERRTAVRRPSRVPVAGRESDEKGKETKERPVEQSKLDKQLEEVLDI